MPRLRKKIFRKKSDYINDELYYFHFYESVATIYLSTNNKYICHVKCKVMPIEYYSSDVGLFFDNPLDARDHAVSVMSDWSCRRIYLSSGELLSQTLERGGTVT